MSNSGQSINQQGKSGKRQNGVIAAVRWVAKYKGIDGFTVSYVHGGGRLDFSNGLYRMLGKTKKLSVAALAEVSKIQSRVIEARDRGYVVEYPRTVYREGVKSTGFRVTVKGLEFLARNNEAVSASVVDQVDKAKEHVSKRFDHVEVPAEFASVKSASDAMNAID